MGNEVKRLRGALSGEATRFLDRVDTFHACIRFLQVSDVACEWIVEAHGRMHQPCEVLRSDIRRHISALKLRVDAVFGGVALRVRTNPAVVLNGSVQRLGAVGDIMTKPACVKNDRLLNGEGWLV